MTHLRTQTLNWSRRHLWSSSFSCRNLANFGSFLVFSRSMSRAWPWFFKKLAHVSRNLSPWAANQVNRRRVYVSIYESLKSIQFKDHFYKKNCENIGLFICSPFHPETSLAGCQRRDERDLRRLPHVGFSSPAVSPCGCWSPVEQEREREKEKRLRFSCRSKRFLIALIKIRKQITVSLL